MAILAFRRAGTSPNPWRPTTAMVTGGPYRLSRNPMYLGFTLLYLGAACWANSLWLLLFLPVILALMQQLVILREERYLERRFGAEYVGYRNRVRRWI
jgi:protein-S-isoprenylcysteine O-methyltransferase Ste14